MTVLDAMLAELATYLNGLPRWRAESQLLRQCCLHAGLEEAWKWK